MRRREWDRCTDPFAMLRDLWEPTDDLPPRDHALYLRRHLVFTLTAARPALARVDHPTCHAAAAVGWRVAEGVGTTEEIAAVREQLQAAWNEPLDPTRQVFGAPSDPWVLRRLVNVLTLVFTAPDGASRHLVYPLALGDPVPLLTPEETRSSCGLLREVFGDRAFGFSSLNWEPDWNTSAAVALARQMYESRDFVAMPILADALQDAGCESKDVLGHCRGRGPHVRGCWVVDLLLGKGKPAHGIGGLGGTTTTP